MNPISAAIVLAFALAATWAPCARAPLFTNSILLPTTEMMHCPSSNHEPSMTGTTVLVMHKMMSTSLAAALGSVTGSTVTPVCSLITFANSSRCAFVGL